MSILNPTNNRLDYGRLLMPPDDYKTSFAIGTTYSLNLQTMLQVPLALFHSKYLSEGTGIKNLRTDMLDALQQVKDKLFVFVHADNIHVPTRYSMLYNFLDQSIYNVQMDNPNANFHPKVWLIRYENKDNFRYRLIVMSRNLAPSVDFDVAASFDSYDSDNVSGSNDSIISFFDWLMLKTGNKKVMRAIRKELREVRFDWPWPFSSVSFCPHTIKSKTLTCPLTNGNDVWEECLVISPFLKDKALKSIRDKTTGTCTLISRKEELDKIDRNVLRSFDGGVFQFVTAEDIDGANDDPSHDDIIESGSVNLHAKLYIVKARLWMEHQPNYHWYLGSTNCTDAALNDNIEALVHLKALAGRKSEVSPVAIIETLSDLKTAIIEPYDCDRQQEVDYESEKVRLKFRRLKWELTNLHIKGSINNLGNNKYQITASVSDTKMLEKIRKTYTGIDIDMNLFNSKEEIWNLNKEESHSFSNYVSCQRITPFLEVSIKYGDETGHYLLMMDIEIPPERDKRMMAEILDTEDKVMKYLMFLLDNNMDAEDMNIGSECNRQEDNGGSNDVFIDYRTPILEKMLLAASRNRKALGRMKDTIDKMKDMKDMHGKALLSKEFMAFWNTFKEFSK